MKIKELYTGLKPFSYILFSNKDSDIAENITEALEKNGYRFWFCPKITPDEKDLREILGKLKSAQVVMLVLSANSIAERLVEDIMEYTLEKRTPILVYLTAETEELTEYLSHILEKAKNAVVFRAWEQELLSSSTVRQALIQTKGITESAAAKFFDKGIKTLRSGEMDSVKIDEAMKNILYAASNEYSPAMNFMGNLALEKARYGNESYSTAVMYYKAAASLGNIDAIYSLGCLIADGEGFAQNYELAESYLSLAAMQGIPDAQYRFAEMLDNGQGVEKNKAEAVKWYQKALSGGERRAYLPLAYRYLEGENVSRDETIAAKYFIQAAEDGVTEAVFMLAKLYRDGVGVRKDAEKAERYFRIAAEKNVAQAQYIYAMILKEKQNYTEYFKWLCIAAMERKYGEGTMNEVLFELGECYRLGLGTEKDRAQAFLYYRMAADSGSKEAAEELAECYRKGLGVHVNKKAADFFESGVFTANREII